jgi:3-oxoacyl-[acyl-carrier protein] reductase
MTEQTAKVAIVTGASRGIGAAVAQRLAKDGFAVAINYAGNTALAEEVAAAIKASGGKAFVVQADVAKASQVASMFDKVEAELGPVTVVVNNAGVMALSPIADISDDEFSRHMDINVRGVFNMLREGARRIKRDGRIINFSTSALGLRMPGYGVYVATKAAVEALTGVLSNELRGRNITVNAIAPGPTGTELFFNGKSPELIEKMSKMPPLERLATPDDIAGVVSFLAGPDGGWVNGQVLRANGGIV